MKTMNLAVAAVLLAFPLWLAAAPAPAMPKTYMADPAAVIAAAAKTTAERHPDADSVILDDRIHTRYEKDGSDITWDDEWVKVLTERGRRSLASVSMDYSERYGDAGVQLVEIIGVDGKVRTIDFKQTLKIATDNSSMGANIYDPLDKTLSCAVPGLAVGEIRHLVTWRRTRKARMRNTWADMSLLEATRPILATTISVDQPPELPVLHAMVRNPFGATVKRAPDRKLADGRTLLSWTARDVPQAFPEPGMPAFSRCVQSLRLTTVKDWPTVSRWYWQMCEAHLAKTTPAMTNKVQELVKDCPTEGAKIRALYKFVSQEVRYMGLTLEGDAPGYEPHDVNVTFDNRYGVCRDKAALLAALLRIAGVKAFPVLIHAGAKMDPEVATPYFNHAITGVEPAGRPREYILMDPTDETSKDLCPAYLSDKSYLVARPEGEGLRTSPVAPYTDNLMKVESNGVLESDGTLQLTTKFDFAGINDTSVRHALVRKTPVERRRWFEGLMRTISAGAELLSLELEPADLRDTDTKLTATTVARFPEFVLRGKTRDSLALPFFTEHFSLVNGQLNDRTALLKRRFPLEMSFTAGSEEKLRLVLGDSVGAVRSLPAPIDAKAGADKAHPKFAFLRKVVCEQGVLSAERRLALAGVDFTVPEYLDLRLARELAETGERETPVFAARRDDDANVHILKDETTVHLVSPTCWVQTNVVEKRILTYQGKKSSSEIRIGYAPSTREVELVSATVTNPDGNVFPVTEKEINLMDAGWAAAAPRYPASKLLVVTLPGVEIGSVIRTVFARKVTQSPTAFTLSNAFGGQDPVDFEKIELHVPNGVRFANPRVTKAFLNAEGHASSIVTNGNGRVFTWSMTKPEREPKENLRLAAARWRPYIAVSTADWPELGGALDRALAAARAEGCKMAREQARKLVQNCATPEERLIAIRRFLAHNLRVVGPGLMELPFDRAFTAPDQALAEGYASDADRMNLAYAMCEAAGFDCAFVLASDDSHGFRRTESVSRALPFPGSYPSLLLRTVWRSGWIPFFRDEQTFWYGGENEYTPAGASNWHADSYYAIADDTFGRIECAAKWAPRSVGHNVISVRENGAVDFSVTNSTYGASVGSMRKSFAEVLPEDRSRFHQRLLAGLAQNATATSELMSDIKGYPFKVSYSAYSEGYAVVNGDAISLELPAFHGSLFDLGGDNSRRKSPIYLGAKDHDEDVFEVVFPKGYTEIEVQPPAFTLVNPLRANEGWVFNTVTHRVVDGRLHVTVKRIARRAGATQLRPDFQPYLKAWNQRAASLEARTITVRRKSK